MTSLLIKLFIKDPNNIKNSAVRQTYGTLASVTGIVINLLLSAAKLTVGLVFGSISITADATNNLSDAGAQIISLISFKISAKPADRDHPFGHARIEYVASMIVSFIVLLIGFELFAESVREAINPVPVEFSWLSVIVLSVSIIAKLWLCLFNRKLGKKISSTVMKATSADSLSDAIATTAVLASMLISKFTSFETDAYMGIIVSVIIMIAGAKILNETKNSILGSAPDPETIDSIKTIVAEYPEILGIHDMVVHNYGPGNTIASLHAEVDGKADVFHTHDVIDNAENALYNRLGVRATIHLDPIVIDDERVSVLREKTVAAVKKIDQRLTIHDFRFVEGTTHTNLIFDVVAPFELKISNDDLKRAVADKVSEIDPNYFVVVTIDRE